MERDTLLEWKENPEEINEGDILNVSPPCGDFVLKYDPSKPIVLLSGGVGLTPIVSMLEYLLEHKYKGNTFLKFPLPIQKKKINKNLQELHPNQI